MIRKNHDPKVGDLATYTLYTDTVGCDVIKVTGSRVWLRERKAILVKPGKCEPGGFAAHWYIQPEYETVENKDGRVVMASKRKAYDGGFFWKLTGYNTRSPGGNVYFGEARTHVDYNF